MMSGKVLWFDDRDGCGVIKDSQGNKYYTDISVIEGRVNLKRGLEVSFELNEAISNALCATNVRIKFGKKGRAA